MTRIDTPRLFLRPMVESDAELIVSWRNEPTARAMFFSDEKLSLDNHLDWFRNHRHNREDFVFCETHQGRPIGTVNFKNIDRLGGSAEAGKLLGDVAYKGKGIAKEAFAAWLLYGFDVLELRHIFIYTRVENVSNVNLNLGLGFKMVNIEGISSPLSAGFIKMEMSLDTAEALRQIMHQRYSIDFRL